jgi:hypothetical protein
MGNILTSGDAQISEFRYNSLWTGPGGGMFRIGNLAGVLSMAGVVWVIALAEGAAQQPRDYGSVVYEAARNKIGLMRYCRNNALLSVGVADRAAAAVQSSLLETALGTALAKEGDFAEKAGEDGFWEANRRHDMARIAKRFGTTPAGLCHEWAQETLRTRQPAQSRQRHAIPISLVQPPRVSPPSRQNVDRRGVIARSQVPKTSDKPPVPAKTAAIPAKAIPAKVAVPAEVAVPEEPKAPAEPVREEPTVNWGTGTIVVWTRTIRMQTQPAREPVGGTVAQNQKRHD